MFSSNNLITLSLPFTKFLTRYLISRLQIFATIDIFAFRGYLISRVKKKKELRRYLISRVKKDQNFQQHEIQFCTNHQKRQQKNFLLPQI